MLKAFLRSIDGARVIHLLLLLGGILLVTIPPLYQGLFFETGYMVHLQFVGLFGIITVYYCFRNKPDWRPNYFLLGLLLVGIGYSLALLSPASTRDALLGWLKAVDYLGVFLLFSAVVSSVRTVRKILLALLASIVLVALYTLVVAAGLMEYNGAVVGGRLYSTFQYPNTFSLYVVLGLLLAWHFLIHEKKRGLRIIAGMAHFPLLVCLMGANSRGGLLVYFAMAVIYAIKQAKRDQWLSLLLLAGFWGMALAFYPHTVSFQQALGWSGLGFTLLGMVCSGLWAWWVIDLRDQGLVAFKPSRSLAVLAVILLSIYMFVYDQSTGQASTPLHRLETLHAEETNISDRLLFYRDAFDMALMRPLEGWGGGGWANIYRTYQSLHYNSTEVHNHFLQTWIEGGILALLGFVGLFAATVAAMIQRWKDSSAEGHLLWVIGCLVLALGLHSAMDFDLSFVSMYVILAFLLALLAYLQKDNRLFEFRIISRQMVLILLAAGSLCLLGYGYSLSQGSIAFQKSQQLLQDPYKDEGIRALEEAVERDPRNHQYLARLGEVLIDRGLSNKDSQQVLRGFEYLEQAKRQKPFDPNIYRVYAGRLIQIGKVEMAKEIAVQGARLIPWLPFGYEEIAYVSVVSGEYHLMNQDRDGAVKSFQEAFQAEAELNKQRESLSPELRKKWVAPPFLEVTPRMALYLGEAAVALKQWDRAEGYLARIQGNFEDPGENLRFKLLKGMVMEQRVKGSGKSLVEEAVQQDPKLAVLKKIFED